MRRGERSGRPGVFRRLAGGTNAAAITLVVVAALGLALVYDRFGRPPPEQTEVIVAQVPHTPAGPPTAQAEASPALSTESSTDFPTPRAFQPPPSTELLRPGASPITRYNLPATATRPPFVALRSRYTATSGCEPEFAELFALQAGRWQRLFAADDPTFQFGAVLPGAESAGSSCFPQLRLFAIQSETGAASSYLLLGVANADSSQRLTVLGWDDAANAIKTLFDWRTGPHGRIDRSVSGDRLDVVEDAQLDLADGSRATIGRLVQSLVLAGDEVTVTTRRVSPNCDRGRLAAPPTAGELLQLRCGDGTQSVAWLAEGTELLPAGLVAGDLRSGDFVQLQFDTTSLSPKEFSESAPTLIALTDATAGVRRAGAARSARPSATAPASRPAAAPSSQSRQPPAAPAGRVQPAAPAARPPAPPSNQAGTEVLPPAVVPPTAPAAGAGTRSGPPVAAPVPLVSPPPAPRAPPFAAPPPAPR